METKEGEISGISKDEGVNKNGNPYTRWVFEMTDGKKYSTFDENIGTAGFSIGDYVEMTGEQKGKYWNMSTMAKKDKPQNDQQIQEQPSEKSSQSSAAPEKSEQNASQKPQGENLQAIEDLMRKILSLVDDCSGSLAQMREFMEKNGNSQDTTAEN